MIVFSAREFLDAYSPERFPPAQPPTARAAFLVSPTGFSLAAESAIDNRYMATTQRTNAERALVEHAELAAALRTCLPTIVFPGDPSTPDAVFPNNVFGTARGRLIVGAMRHSVRRREAQRVDIRAFFTDLLGYEIVDFSSQEFPAELTGSLVIDHARRIGFCGLSQRCDRDGARAMHSAFDLKLTFCFDLAPGEYHTNVVLAVLASRALLIAPDGFADADAAHAIAHAYGERVIRLDARQKSSFAANAITLSDDVVWMGERAASSLSAAQVDALSAWGFAIRSVPLDEIEKAGGSLRCCVGEIF